MRGTAAMLRAPPPARRFTHSEIGGRESSINPPSTESAGFFSLTNATSSWNSRAPRGSRLPCPTMSSAGPAPFSMSRMFAVTARFRTSVLLVVYERVQSRRRDRGAPFGTVVRDRGQPTFYQFLFGFSGPDKTDREPDNERRFSLQFQQLEERRRRVPDYPDGTGPGLLRRNPKPRRRTGDAQTPGELAGAGVGDETQGLPSSDASGDHTDIRRDRSIVSYSFKPPLQDRFVEDEALSVIQVRRRVDDTLDDRSGERPEV